MPFGGLCAIPVTAHTDSPGHSLRKVPPICAGRQMAAKIEASSLIIERRYAHLRDKTPQLCRLQPGWRGIFGFTASRYENFMFRLEG